MRCMHDVDGSLRRCDDCQAINDRMALPFDEFDLLTRCEAALAATRHHPALFCPELLNDVQRWLATWTPAMRASR